MRRGRENASARAPAVAGAFYPADADTLRREVSALLAAARPPDLPAPPKALIVPHAGYVYSGAVAAAAYALLRESCRTLRRVVLIGPSHRVPLAGIAVPGMPMGSPGMEGAYKDKFNVVAFAQDGTQKVYASR